MYRPIWIHDDSDLVEAIGQVLLRVQTDDVNAIYLSNGRYSNTLNARDLNKEQLVETLAKWSLAYTVYYVEVEMPWTRSVLFAFNESKDGTTNITWDIIEQIVDVIAVWRKQREKMGVLFKKPWQEGGTT